VMDGLDGVSVGEAVAAARPDVIVHQMTAIAGRPNMRHLDRWFAITNRLRTEGTDHLLAAAEATGVPHVVAQVYASWNGIRQGGRVKTEEDPLDLHVGTPAHAVMEALRHVEDAVGKADGAVLRYGGLCGPVATEDQVELVRKRQFPLIGVAPATARGCISTTPRARPSWHWSSRRGACTTSSTTNLPWPGSGCPIWQRARAWRRGFKKELA
jgi:nucleoside-diphosphate-sugar epimerase